jgi:hypothetical protein
LEDFSSSPGIPFYPSVTSFLLYSQRLWKRPSIFFLLSWVRLRRQSFAQEDKGRTLVEKEMSWEEKVKEALYCLLLPLRVESCLLFLSSFKILWRWRCNRIYLNLEPLFTAFLSLCFLFNLWLIASFRILMTDKRRECTQHNRKQSPNNRFSSFLCRQNQTEISFSCHRRDEVSYLFHSVQVFSSTRNDFSFMSWDHVSPAIFLFNEYTNKRRRELEMPSFVPLHSKWRDDHGSEAWI